MTMPALQRLRERFPQSRITLLTPAKLSGLWQHFPGLNAIMPILPDESPLAVGRRLRTEAYQLALILPNSPRSALETWFGRIPKRIGYAKPWRTWFLTRALPARSGPAMRKRSVSEIRRLVQTPPAPSQPGENPSIHHQIHDYLALTASVGADATPIAPSIHVKDEELCTTAEKFRLSPNEAKQIPVFGLNPGAEYGPAKRWPAELFISAAAQVQRQIQCRWLIFGGQGDFELADKIACGISSTLPQNDPRLPAENVLNLAGKTTLRELCALLKLCRVLLTNDTGPMHVAAAAGTPLVVPFGSTSPELTGPGLPGNPLHHLLRSAAPCSPCFRRECPIDFRCMHGIGVERVVQAVLQAARPTSDELR